MSENGLERRKLGAFTIAKDETYFLDIWVNYYSRSIPKNDLFILDHDSSADNTKVILDRLRSEGVNVIPIHNDLSYNHYWLRTTVEKFQRFMLSSYEIVLFSEPDEVIIPRPDLYSVSLSEYIQRKMKETGVSHLRCVGYSLEHQRFKEPPIDLSKPIMSQRKVWRYHYYYDKTLISSVPCSWDLGFHNLVNVNSAPDRDRHLLLIHLHKLDYDLCLAKHKQRAAFKWADDKDGFNANNQNRICDGDEFDLFFDTDSFVSNPVEIVPKFMEGAF